MALISLEEAKAGLILEKDLKNGHGQLLAAAGTAITERHLILLRSWGVTQIDVLMTGEAAKKLSENLQITQELMVKAEAELLELFSLANGDDPVMQEIRRQCVSRKAKTLS